MLTKTINRLAVVFTVWVLTACTLAGPNYQRPEPVATMPLAYKEETGWKLAKPHDGLSDEHWWELYHDPQLNALAEQVAGGNQNIREAEARLRQAHAFVGAAKAGAAPVGSAGVAASRALRSQNLGSGVGTGSSVSDFQIPLQVAWELDLWGKIRLGVEASEANDAASNADLAALRLSMQAELVGDYFQVQALDVQKQLLNDTMVAYRKILGVTRNRYAAGVAGKADQLQAESQLQSVEAQAVDLDVQRSQLEHAIAVLIGTPPAAFALPPETHSSPILVIPPGLPSELLERRPDIAAAERRMAAANAQIGVAAAAYFPAIRLGAAAGVESAGLGTWLSWPSRFWSLGPILAATLFDGGLRQAQSEQALASYDASVATYRQSVLTAFQEVEDALATLKTLEEEASVQEAALQTAKQSVAVVTNQYQAGTVSSLNLLVAQAALLANDRTTMAIQSRRLTASVLLVKALGGGWHKEEMRQVTE